MKINIRKAEADDLDQVYGLICELAGSVLDKKTFQETYSQNLASVGISYWVIANENKVVGFVSLHVQELLHHSKKVAEVQELCVDENYRGK